MTAIDRVQSIFDAYSIRPCYVIDYAVASQKEGVDPLLPIWESERCIIGAHLHPWINPPHTEEVNARNSYPGNLSMSAEHAKLDRLSKEIESSFGEFPRIYKAGRYGVGANTSQILEGLDYDFDLRTLIEFTFPTSTTDSR